MANGHPVVLIDPATDLPYAAAGSGTGAGADQVQGNAASGAADVGNPVKAAGRYNASAPTLADGQRGDLQLTPGAGLIVAGRTASGGTPSDNPVLVGALNSTTGFVQTLTGMAQNGDGGAGSTVAINVKAHGNLFNGTTGNGAAWDRARSITGALADGTGLGVAAVEAAGSLFSNITTATTTTVKSGKGVLHRLNINTYVAAATITIYDNTAASGTKIATITLPATITSDVPYSMPFDIQFNTGLTIVTSGATDITACYR